MSAIHEFRPETPTWRQLRYVLGKDYESVKADPGVLAAVKRLLRDHYWMNRGICPPDYTAETTCVSCGVVPIFPGAPEKVSGCPWCHRKSGPTDARGETRWW